MSRRAVQSELARAISFGDSEAVRRLIDEGADVTYVDEHDNTPLGLAHLHRRGVIERILIAAGALPLELTPVAGGLTPADVKRLLVRLKRTRASLVIPKPPADRVFERVLRRGRIEGMRITLVLDPRPLPRCAPATRRALLEALGYEGFSWLQQEHIATQGDFRIGTAQPWYTLLPRSVARARKVVAQIGA